MVKSDCNNGETELEEITNNSEIKDNTTVTGTRFQELVTKTSRGVFETVTEAISN